MVVVVDMSVCYISIGKSEFVFVIIFTELPWPLFCFELLFSFSSSISIYHFHFFRCDFNFSTPVELTRHGIYENYRQTWDGNRVTVFASAQLGLYPYYSEDGSKVYNGGLPQVRSWFFVSMFLTLQRKSISKSFKGFWKIFVVFHMQTVRKLKPTQHTFFSNFLRKSTSSNDCFSNLTRGNK